MDHLVLWYTEVVNILLLPGRALEVERHSSNDAESLGALVCHTTTEVVGLKRTLPVQIGW